MGVQSKYTEDQKDKAVKRYGQGEPVRALAKEYKCSVPVIYTWIAAKKQEMAEKAALHGKRPETIRLEKDLNLELLVKQQSEQIEHLKKRLFDFMVKYNEL